MHVFEAFELDVQPDSPDNSASSGVALLRYTRGGDRRLFIAPECAFLAGTEGQIKGLSQTRLLFAYSGDPVPLGCCRIKCLPSPP